MSQILVVEDESDIRDVLCYSIKREGYDVVSTERGRDALEQARVAAPGLVLLDLTLPDISGLSVCRELKQTPALSATPVIMLTARGTEDDRVAGFEHGADDYVVKPFSVRELLLRMRVLLQRTPRAEPATTTNDEISFGSLKVAYEAHRVWVNGQEILLTRLEMRLLRTLHDRRGRVQTRGTLLSHVWESNPRNDSRTVDTHVKRLREKLGAAADYVETVRGIGYRFAETPENC